MGTKFRVFLKISKINIFCDKTMDNIDYIIVYNIHGTTTGNKIKMINKTNKITLI